MGMRLFHQNETLFGCYKLPNLDLHVILYFLLPLIPYKRTARPLKNKELFKLNSIKHDTGDAIFKSTQFVVAVVIYAAMTVSGSTCCLFVFHLFLLTSLTAGIAPSFVISYGFKISNT